MHVWVARTVGALDVDEEAVGVGGVAVGAVAVGPTRRGVRLVLVVAGAGAAAGRQVTRQVRRHALAAVRLHRSPRRACAGTWVEQKRAY